MKEFTAWGLIWITACLAVAEPVIENGLLQGTLTAIQRGKQTDHMERLTSRLSQRLTESFRLRPQELNNTAVAVDCVRYMQWSQQAPPGEAVNRWVLADQKRLHLLAGTILPEDNLQRCWSNLDTLLKHDRAGAEIHFKLMLALSVVWDTPNRPLIHGQMGKERLSYEPEIASRYDYFKALYETGEAKVPYEDLGVGELIFVVETPVPLSELKWALENEEGSLRDWGDKFSDIIYDDARLQAMQYSWPSGMYCLADIKGRGGICVDQAYYAVMTARAFGIPSIYFHAKGASGGHAWFSYMEKPGTWVLDIGRYANQNYTTGFATNPQTNRQMTDHDVIYTCERSKYSSKRKQAGIYLGMAQTLLKPDPDNARLCAREARRLDPKDIRPWQIELDLLVKEKDSRDLLRFFDSLKNAFSKHPDMVVDAANKVESVLRAAGQQEEADNLKRSLSRNVGNDRDDLARFLGQDEIEQLVADGDIKKARRKMEDLLEDHIQEGSKVFSMIQGYLKLTKGTNQVRPAARFLEDYIDELLQTIDFSPGYEKILWRYLSQAYLQAGDEKNREKIEEHIRRF